MADSSSDYCDDSVYENSSSTAEEEEYDDLSVDDDLSVNESESSVNSDDEYNSNNNDIDDDDSTEGVSDDVLSLLTDKLPKFVKKNKDERKKYASKPIATKYVREKFSFNNDVLNAGPMYVKASKQLNGKGGQKEIDKIINGEATGKATGTNIDTNTDINNNNKNNNDSNCMLVVLV
jgi:hypothetical protein